MNVLIVDDHALFRDATSLLIADAFKDATILDAANVEEAVQLARHYTKLDLVILDLSLPGIKGAEALSLFGAGGVAVPIIVVTANEDPATVKAVIEGGAAGYVPKRASSRTLLNAIKIVLAGDLYVPQEYLGLSPTNPTNGHNGARAELTERQHEVVQLVAKGYTNKQIAETLYVTEATVKLHVSTIMRQLNAVNRTDAVVKATRAGLIQD